MTSLPIVTDLAALRVKSQPVTVFDDDLRQLATDMVDTMRANNGIGLAAVQVGRCHRVLLLLGGADRRRYDGREAAVTTITWEIYQGRWTAYLWERSEYGYVDQILDRYTASIEVKTGLFSVRERVFGTYKTLEAARRATEHALMRRDDLYSGKFIS